MSKYSMRADKQKHNGICLIPRDQKSMAKFIRLIQEHILEGIKSGKYPLPKLKEVPKKRKKEDSKESNSLVRS